MQAKILEKNYIAEHFFSKYILPKMSYQFCVNLVEQIILPGNLLFYNTLNFMNAPDWAHINSYTNQLLSCVFSFDHFSLDYYAPQGKQYASGVVLLFNPSNKYVLPRKFLSIHNRQQQEINSVLGASVCVFLNKSMRLSHSRILL